MSLIMGTGRSGKELGRYCGCWGIRGRDGRRTDVGKLQCLQEDHMALMWGSRRADALLVRRMWSLIIY